MENGFSSKIYNKIATLVSLGILLGVVDNLAAVHLAFADKNMPKSAERVSGELIVQMRDNSPSFHTQATVFTTLQKALGDESILDVRAFKTDNSLFRVKIARDHDLAKALDTLKREPTVKYAEPNFIYRVSEVGVPDDADFAKLWGIYNTGQTDAAGQIGTPGADINVLPLWKQGFTGSRNVLVAVIDTGVDWTHPDLEANIYTNPSEAGDKATNGKDDDGNGFIDDVHGWNFDAGTNNSRDDHDHGSHVSGTIGGVGNNAQGVVGVNWNVSILPVKFLSASGGGTLENAVEAINYARVMKVNIMSNSWGGGGFSQILKDSIEATHKMGILFVAAAGNDSSNNDESPAYPASYDIPNVLSVAATDNKDNLARFSNYGTTSVHVAAPGVKTYSTTKDGKYDTFSGTSMATPHVSGVSALMLSLHPEWTFAEIKDRLIKTSDPVRMLKRKVVAKGRINAFNAVYGIVPPVDEPDESKWITVERVVESEHPYKDYDDLTFTVNYPGARFIRVIFDKVDVERNYDKVILQSSSGETADEISGFVTDYKSEYINGDTLVIRLKADESNTGYGFKISKIQVITGKKPRKGRRAL